METQQINVTFDDNTLAPILTFIEETRNGNFTNGYFVPQYPQSRDDMNTFSIEGDSQCLIYGISY